MSLEATTKRQFKWQGICILIKLLPELSSTCSQPEWIQEAAEGCEELRSWTLIRNINGQVTALKSGEPERRYNKCIFWQNSHTWHTCPFTSHHHASLSLSLSVYHMNRSVRNTWSCQCEKGPGNNITLISLSEQRVEACTAISACSVLLSAAEMVWDCCSVAQQPSAAHFSLRQMWIVNHTPVHERSPWSRCRKVRPTTPTATSLNLLSTWGTAVPAALCGHLSCGSLLLKCNCPLKQGEGVFIMGCLS